MNSYNKESLQLIKEYVGIFTKPSQVLRWADEHKDVIKQITGTYNNMNCGYCARGIIGQYMNGGEEAFETYEPGVQIYKNVTKYNEIPDIVMFLKCKFNTDNKNMIDVKEYMDIKYLLLDIARMNDNGKTFIQIAEYLESKGF